MQTSIKKFFVVGKLENASKECVLSSGYEFDLLADVLENVGPQWKHIRIVPGAKINSALKPCNFRGWQSNRTL